MGEVRVGLFLWSRSSWQRSEEPAEGSPVVGGSSCFHSLCGLFVIPRNKADWAGLRVGQAVCSGLHAFTPLASFSSTLAFRSGDASLPSSPSGHCSVFKMSPTRARLLF